MTPKGLISQLGMIAISIAIVFTFIKPQFEKVSGMQDDIAVYQAESGKVTEVNDQLSVLLERLKKVTPDDEKRLDAYMPNSVDVIAVPRDLLLISEQAGVLYISSSHLGEVDPDAGVQNAPVENKFQLSVEGTYRQIKNLLRLMERNNYILEVNSLNISALQGGFLSADITLSSYSYRSSITDNKIVF